MTSWTDAIAAYATALRAARRSPGTVRVHMHYLRRLAGIHRNPWTVTTAHLRKALDVPRWAAETQKSCRGVFVSFYRWALAEGHVTTDPTLRLASISVPVGLPRPAPEVVLERALGMADSRERLMLKLAAYAGLRCAEIAAVNCDNLVGNMLYVTGKGEKTRVVPIVDDELVGALRTGEGWLFPSAASSTGHLTPGHVTRLLSDVLPGEWTGHTLRHRFATRSHAANADILALGRVLGHSRPETTMRYVLVPEEALLRVVRAAA